MTTLDEIQARADLAQGAWEDFQQGIATTRFALDEANNSAEDVPKLVAALRGVEAAHVLTCEQGASNCLNGEACPLACCGPCGEPWPCPTIRAIRDTLT